MTRYAALFPGQGSQNKNMFESYEKNTIFIIGELSDGDHIEMVEYCDIISPRICFGY